MLTCAAVYVHSLQRSTKLDESRHHAARESETLSIRVRANDYTLWFVVVNTTKMIWFTARWLLHL